MQTTNRKDWPPISETLFIPLAARAAETTRKNPIFTDEKSLEMLRTIDTSTTVTDGGELATQGILARTKVIDDEVKKIIAQTPNAVILNLGAGLDTRMNRIDNGLLTWFDLDLPEVISLRSRFFSENDRVRFISKSVLDASWVEEIPLPENSTVVIVAEGLLMYFPEEDVIRFFTLLAKRFSGAHLFFDVVHRFFVNKKMSSPFLWGLDRAKDIEKLNEQVRLVQAWSTGNLLKERQSMLIRILNLLPSTRNRSQILHIQFAREDAQSNRR
ncbi:class I SAM-dependent methyltransferase [Gorillibacterium timonense]|uniref:class I SAM-dependent methyltransferase n=1 Tax=Gorillibacterium timonense TaxID=1689269 RepID=UPI00071C7C2D|nr:class I SAM-dependent methyltransferase [Gorillibacterium timonense]